jgi:hypothetical protein
MRYQPKERCNSCDALSPLDLTIDLDNGPTERKSLTHAFGYKGRQIPSELVELVHLPLRP